MFPSIETDLYQWTENKKRKKKRKKDKEEISSENSHETEEIRETKKIYSKGYEFYIWAIYAVHPFLSPYIIYRDCPHPEIMDRTGNCL